MDEQLGLAFADRHAGQEACLAAATSVLRDDRSRVEGVVARLARRGEAFTADDVHAALSGGEEYRHNVVSSVIGLWAKNGLIVEDRTIAPVASAHRSRRASRNRWWRGPVTATSEGGAA